MANNTTEKSFNPLFKEFTSRAFGGKKRYIVDLNNPLPKKTISGYAIVIEAVTGFSCTDIYLDESGGNWPTQLPVGLEIPDGLMNITVDQGKILCFIK